jgi:hypothetical protein
VFAIVLIWHLGKKKVGDAIAACACMSSWTALASMTSFNQHFIESASWLRCNSYDEQESSSFDEGVKSGYHYSLMQHISLFWSIENSFNMDVLLTFEQYRYKSMSCVVLL